MNLKLVAAALLLAGAQSSFAELPQHAPRPGGIAVIDLGPRAKEPRAVFDDRPALIMQQNDRWFAVVGIPLSAIPGIAEVEISGEENETATFEIVAHQYREQRLNVERRYVEPNPEQLERILGERRTIDAAINTRRATPVESLALASPVPGKRSDSFGFRRFFNDQPRAPHSGMDIAAVTGTPVRAPLDGIVVATGNYFFNGNTVIVDHGQGFVTLYCHLDQIDVNENDTVAAGDTLGAVGATGRVTGAHLHFSTYLGGTAVDPALLLNAKNE